MPDWKDTLNLPRTDFAMKANLQVTEPQMLAHWEATRLYEQLRERRRGRPAFVLHDGPPYANGNIHLGTTLNKVLKDFVVRSRSMMGFDAPYVPGWDCHGLPIELKVVKELGPKRRDMSIADFRRACRAYATRFVGIQRDEFKRLAVMGDWTDPYLTMDFRYQAAIVRALGRFVEQGMVYKGKKPVHWCIHCRTALAEAEVEYEDHTSPSIYVEFPLTTQGTAELGARVPALRGRRVSALIWTTTPWTIPSNLALAFHPEARYGAFDVDGRIVVVAESLAEQLSQVLGRDLGRSVAQMPGSVFEGLRFSHPLYARESVGVLADYVTLDTGTGVVHTAPGHGADDFHTGVKYGLDVYAPVDGDGRFLPEVERFAGLTVFEANPKVEEALAAAERLWKSERFSHAYPHCWRCHHPVIFLATSQWFIGMDDTGLRRKAIDETARVAWHPAWGGERMRGMFESRPDWCISRQRAWGVPIPAVTCAGCGTATLTAELVERAAQTFERDGAEAWYERPVGDFLPPGFSCPSCGGEGFERETDILDVWFDSGSSHEAVLSVHPELRWPADLYLEGTDQYRGWFQSSMLVALGTRGRAPYDGVLTHGMVVTEEGKKMSKSLGNDIPPGRVISQSGAEILRLWVASVDFREEVRFGPEIIARVVEAYRKFRNTLRILAANLADRNGGFDPARDAVPLDSMLEVDRFALARYADLSKRVRQAYEAFDFPAVFQAVNAFLTVDMSAFYVDVSKDRLYTLAAGDPARRSAQTAMFIIADGLARLVAPILPVLAEDFWRHLPGERETSVHLAEFRQDDDRFADAELTERWQRLLRVRTAVNSELEKLRKAKTIGQSLEASVSLRATGALADLLRRHEADLPMLFIASDVDLASGPGHLDAVPNVSEAEGSALGVEVARTSGTRCDRCWRYVPAVSNVPGREGVCPRCEAALSESAL